MDTVLAVNISARRVAVGLLAIAGGLTLAHILAVVAWYEDLLPVENWLYYSFFDLDEEESLGTWFAALLLFLAGQLSWLQSRFVAGRAGGKHAWWLLLAIGFHLLSLDEVAGFHEAVNTVVEGTHWTIFGALIGLAAGVAFLPFLWSLPARTRLQFIAAGTIFLGGAVGVEWGTIWYEDNDALDTLPYNLWNALEEGLEMAGVILFIFAVLDHIPRAGQRSELHARVVV